MNIASLELCKELYELSGWYTTPSWYKHPSTGLTTLRPAPDKIGKQFEQICPAYDLGYLLRKLPDQSHIYKHIQGPAGNYSAWTLGDHKAVVDTMRGETPEDAACTLAIELFKQGVLKK